MSIPKPDDKLKSFTVAPGRTVITDTSSVGPGEPVELEISDAKRLYDLGFLLGEDGTPKLHTEGPAVVAGAEIKER